MKVEVEVAELEELRAEVRRLKGREQEFFESSARLVAARRDVDRQGMVRQFMRVFGQPISTTPGQVPHELTPSLHGFVGIDLVRFRLRLVFEECFELIDACIPLVGAGVGMPAEQATDMLREARRLIELVIDGAPIDVDLPAAIDATLDIDYVSQGFRDTFGVDSTPLWLAVHKSNMAKAGEDGIPRRRPEDGKVLKPDGWAAPDIAGELRRQGWAG